MNGYRCRLSENERAIVAEFEGEITTQNYPQLRDDYNEICRLLISSERKQLVVDLTDTSYFTSLFVGIVLQLSNRMREHDGRIVLCGLSDQLRELLSKLLLLERSANVEPSLQHFETQQEAQEFLFAASK